MKIKRILLALFFLLALVACTTDLSKRSPYQEAIGKQFVLQKDLYIYYFNDYDDYPWLSFPCKLRVGHITPKGSFFYNLPEAVEEKYIGTKNSQVSLKGILWKGTVFTLKRVSRCKTIDDVYYYYVISPNQGAFAGQEINPYDIISIFENPPYSQTWSDPPIFEPEYALPLPSDGTWWK